MGTDAASLEPCIAEDLVEQGYELAEMSYSWSPSICRGLRNSPTSIVGSVIGLLLFQTVICPGEKLAEEGFNVLTVAFFAVRWRLVVTCGEMFVVQRGESDDLRAQKRYL